MGSSPSVGTHGCWDSPVPRQGSGVSHPQGSLQLHRFWGHPPPKTALCLLLLPLSSSPLQGAGLFGAGSCGATQLPVPGLEEAERGVPEGAPDSRHVWQFLRFLLNSCYLHRSFEELRAGMVPSSPGEQDQAPPLGITGAV